jgi:hypothetical protein
LFEAPQPPSAAVPLSVAVVSVVLVLAGVGAALVGLAASALSGCCGARDGGDSTLALLGIGMGAAVVVSGVLLWRGGSSRSFVLVPAAVLPVACLAAAPSSSDLAGLAPFALAGWVLLAVFVSRGRAARWLAADRRVED